MLALLASWVAFPLLLGLLAQGAGTILEAVAGRPLAVGIRLPCGLALLMALLDLGTRTTATAPLAVPLAIAVGVVGLALSRPWRWRWPGWASPATALGAFAVYAAPIVLSGQATLAGYIKLDDTATWIALVDRALSHGRSLAGLAPSTYQINLAGYLTAGYPLGSFLPLGLGRTLTGQDLPWLVDPWMAFMAAMLALALAHIARLALRGREPASAGAASPAGATVAATSAAPQGRSRTGKVTSREDAEQPVMAAAGAEAPAGASPGKAKGKPAGAAPASSAPGKPALAASARRPKGKHPPTGSQPETKGAQARTAGAQTSKPSKPSKPSGRAAAPAKAARGGQTGGQRRAPAGSTKAHGGPTPAATAPAWVPPVIGIVAAQSALLYGYYLWGGMKEMAGALLVAAFAVAAPLALGGELSLGARARALIPALVVVWALVAALSSAGLVWVGPGVVLAAVLLLAPRVDTRRVRTRMRAAGRRDALVVGGVLVLLALGAYIVLRPGGFFQRYKAVLTGGTQLGNLAKPLSFLQIAGIWPSQDFRFPSDVPGLTYILIVLVIAAAVAGLVIAVRRQRVELVLYVSCALAAAIAVFAIASPWVGAKSLASASPALPLAALVGVTWLAELGSRRWGRGRARSARGPRIAAAVAGVLIVAGVLWSNGLGYHGVSLAPRQEFAELGQIGHVIAGQGPTLLTEYDTYGERYFLREAAPDSVSDLRARTDPLAATGKPLPNGGEADIDNFELSSILAYRTLVLQRSPVGRRPPSPYRLIFQDRFWDVWQRPPQVNPPLRVFATLPDLPGTVPACKSVMALASRPGIASLVAAPVTIPIGQQTAAGTHPASWANGSNLNPTGAGTATIPIHIAQAGNYQVWLGGSIHGPLSVSVNGLSVGTARNELQWPDEFVPFGDVALKPGTYTVTVRHGSGTLLPGSGGAPDAIGPLVLVRQGSSEPLITVPVADARALCGRTLEWIEGVGA